MAQPNNQKASCAPAGKLDSDLGEFWLDNPWAPTEHNLSAYERNRVLLNTGDGRFADVSHASGGADLDSDSRSVVYGDFNSDGMPDLLVRNSGGGPVRLFLNSLPKKHSVTLSLQGTASNRRGIGARITAWVDGQERHREVQAHSGFQGQLAAQVSLGIGDAQSIEKLEVLWPSGEHQEFLNLQAGRHYRLIEGQGAPDVIAAPPTESSG